MQVRRLITILNKMVKENPSIAYAPIGIYPKAFIHDYHAVRGFNEQDIDIEIMEWDNGKEVEQRQPRQVLVIGCDQFRCDYKDEGKTIKWKEEKAVWECKREE
jgi:hypothetical protein